MRCRKATASWQKNSCRQENTASISFFIVWNKSILTERKDSFEQILQNRLRLSPAINGSADKASAYFDVFISKPAFCFVRPLVFPAVKAAIVTAQTFRSSIHNFTQASEGIRQSPRGESVTLPTFGPSGRQERLYCCAKNLL